MSLLARLLEKAEAEPGLHYRNPSLPHACAIPGGLGIGNKIYIQGTVPPQPDRFKFNLQRGADVDSADIYFHFNPRFQESCIVRNTRSSGEWGPEEKDGDNPFSPNSPFLMVITAYSDNYEVEVNGNVCTSFKHRDGLPLSNVTHMAINGDVIIWALHIPVDTMPKNLRLSIPDNTNVGDIFTIKGNVPHGADRFVINLQCGPAKSDDVVFHFNPRISDGIVVRNSRADEQWANEDKEGATPFSEGQPFTLVIAATSDAFRTWVDDKEFILFPHRLDMSAACTLFIEGDLNTERILIDSVPNKLPPWTDDSKIRHFKNALAEVFHPTLRLAQRIKGDMSPGRVVFLSATIKKEPISFYVNLQCDSTEDSDVAFHYNPRLNDGVLVMNSKNSDQWGEEIRITDPFPFAAGLRFELQILCLEGSFVVSVNGTKLGEMDHRVDISRIDHVAVDGSIIVHRLLCN